MKPEQLACISLKSPNGVGSFIHGLKFWFIFIRNDSKQDSKNALQVEINSLRDDKYDIVRKSCVRDENSGVELSHPLHENRG